MKRSRGSAPAVARRRPGVAPAAPIAIDPATAPEPAAARAAIGLWIVLALLTLARAAASFAPTMAWWSLNLTRFLPPLAGWGLWALSAIALLPAVARHGVPWLERASRFAEEHPALATLAGAGLATALVLVFPDRVRFVGDFLLRQGTVEEGEKPSLIYPQALPLDVLLHYRLPLALVQAAVLDANGAGRALGAIEAGLLAWLAMAFTRTLGLRGAAAAAAGATLFFGGALGLFTGFSKAFSELCLLVALLAVLGLWVVREGRGLLPLGLAAAIGITLHRSALGVLPALAVAWAFWLRSDARRESLRRPGTIVGLALPLLSLAVMLPRILSRVRAWDVQHFAPAEAQGSLLAAAFAGTRPLDLVNLVLMLSPIAVAALVVALALGRGLPRARELAYLVVLAFPFLLFMPFIHPAQGLFRDWDDFAASGVALSVLAAWLVGETLRASPRHAWLAMAIVAAVAAPSLQLLAHNADLDRGLARVEAFMREPPQRTPAERGKTWDYLGIRNYRAERYPASAAAFARAAETAPSPRIMEEWGAAETAAGNLKGAQAVYRDLLRRNPGDRRGWVGLAAVSAQLGDLDEARRAVNEALKLSPGDPEALQILAYLDRVQSRSSAAQDSARAGPSAR